MSEQGHSSRFVLLARGPVDDPGAVRRRWDDWHERIAAASGWQGSTGGVASTGDWLAAIRYSSEEAARASAEGGSDHGFLSGATSLELTGDLQLVEGNGPPLAAGFVQFMRARVPERHRLEAVEAAVGDRFAAVRRDFLAGLRAWTGPDRLTVVDWFTSEAEARAGEATAIPPELERLFGEWMSLLHDVEWYDLGQPWQVAPEPRG
ncbi:MAG: hypothetical protein M3203_06445 [Actinomycetota bacterium]|nr:hypothetical protein [Actinomycetota bacterium]